MLRFLSEFHISLVKQQYMKLPKQRNPRRSSFQGLVENHGGHGGWEAILSFHASHPETPWVFHEKVGIPKKTRNAHRGRMLRPYQVTLEKASLKLGKDWQKNL